jgi:hypothetical protein
MRRCPALGAVGPFNSIGMWRARSVGGEDSLATGGNAIGLSATDACAIRQMSLNGSGLMVVQRKIHSRAGLLCQILMRPKRRYIELRTVVGQQREA